MGRTVGDAVMARARSALIPVTRRRTSEAVTYGTPSPRCMARIGVLRNAGFTGYSPETDAVFEQALDALRALGA